VVIPIRLQCGIIIHRPSNVLKALIPIAHMLIKYSRYLILLRQLKVHLRLAAFDVFSLVMMLCLFILLFDFDVIHMRSVLCIVDVLLLLV
jgi:hypothetical protein